MQEFHIWLTPIKQDSYLVQTQQVAPGVPLAEELVTLSLEELLTKANELNYSLQAVLQDDMTLAAADANIINLGKQLYNALFPGSVRDSWLIAQEIAQNQQEVLRLCLRVTEPMAELPWGIIHTGDYFLATNPRIAFSYYPDTLMSVHSLPHPCPPDQDHSDELLPALENHLLDEDWDEEIDLADDAYEEDSALVSDLFRQLHNQPTAVNSAMPDTNSQLPEVAVSDPNSPSTDKSNLAEPPLLSSENTSIASTPEVKKPRFPSGVQMPIQAVGVIGIVLMGLWWFQQPQKFYPLISPSPTANANLNASNSQLQAIAIQNFNSDNLSAGSLAVEELLNRGALQSAAAALSNVSEPQAQTSTINFLRGRLAWQFIKVGDKKYNLNDVRSYWETAVKSQPNSLKYNNALAFLYYIQDDLNKANQTWFQALYLVEEQNAKSTPALSKRDQLNAYAGLALVLSKSAEAQPSDQQVRFLSEAIKLRQKVLTQDPVNFQPQTLSKTWLWTEKTIQDWRSLLKLKAS